MTTAKDISDQALRDMSSMIRSKHFKNETAVYRQIAQCSGLSQSLVRQFYLGYRPNLTTDTLDKLVAGIAVVNRMKAA